MVGSRRATNCAAGYRVPCRDCRLYIVAPGWTREDGGAPIWFSSFIIIFLNTCILPVLFPFEASSPRLGTLGLGKCLRLWSTDTGS